MALPGKLDGLEGYPLVPKLEKAVGIPVVAENDGRVSMVAEKHYGLARRKKWAVSLTLGTGVGSGVMLDGQILRDPHLQFGTQMGHIVIQAAGGRLLPHGSSGNRDHALLGHCLGNGGTGWAATRHSLSSSRAVLC